MWHRGRWHTRGWRASHGGYVLGRDPAQRQAVEDLQAHAMDPVTDRLQLINIVEHICIESCRTCSLHVHVIGILVARSRVNQDEMGSRGAVENAVGRLAKDERTRVTSIAATRRRPTAATWCSWPCCRAVR